MAWDDDAYYETELEIPSGRYGKLIAIPGGPGPSGPVGPAGPAGPAGPPGPAEGVEFVARTVTERLQTIAFLNRDLEIVFADERPDKKQKITYQYKGGIVDFVKHLNASREALFTKVAHYEASEADQTVDVALQWNTGYYEGIYGYANGISTVEGGMHVEGFKTALTSVLNKYARASGALKEKDENLLGEDIREGITAILL